MVWVVWVGSGDREDTIGLTGSLFAETDFLVNMSASADVLAQAKVEIDLAAIPEGKNVCALPHIFPTSDSIDSRGLFVTKVIVKWRGKPVFIRHRTEGEIKEAEDTKWESLRDPQPDSERVQKPEWLIMLGETLLHRYSLFHKLQHPGC